MLNLLSYLIKLFDLFASHLHPPLEFFALIDLDLHVYIFFCRFELFVVFCSVLLDVIAIDIPEFLQVVCRIFYFFFCQLEKIQSFEIWTSVENESKPKLVSVTIEGNFTDCRVDRKIHVERIESESWIICRNIYCYYFHCWIQFTPRFKDCF